MRSNEIVKMSLETGVMFGQKGKTRTVNSWITSLDSNGKSNEQIIDTDAVSKHFQDESDKQRNRTAFGFIAIGYSIQIVGLLLGKM